MERDVMVLLAGNEAWLKVIGRNNYVGARNDYRGRLRLAELLHAPSRLGQEGETEEFRLHFRVLRLKTRSLRSEGGGLGDGGRTRAAAFGEDGYKRAGYTLARHVDDLFSDVYDRPQFESQLNELADALKIEPSEDEALEWFDREFPRCMELVPARRRSQFIQGAAQAYEEGLLV